MQEREHVYTFGLNIKLGSSYSSLISVVFSYCLPCLNPYYWQEEYDGGDDIGTLECGHDFHTNCIKQWLMQKNLCPICKTTGLLAWKKTDLDIQALKYNCHSTVSQNFSIGVQTKLIYTFSFGNQFEVQTNCLVSWRGREAIIGGRKKKENWKMKLAENGS